MDAACAVASPRDPVCPPREQPTSTPPIRSPAFRDRFVPSPGLVAYLDGNSLGRPLIASADRIERLVREEWAGRLIRGWDEGWLDLPLRLGDELGRVALGAAPGQTAFGDSTTVLIYKQVRAALALRPGRDELVISRDDFPTDRYVLEGIAAEAGATLRWLEPGDVTPDAVAAAVGEAHRRRGAVRDRVPLGLRRRGGAHHRDRARRRRAGALGPLPRRRRLADRARRLGRRPRRRLQLQVPQRRAGCAGLRLRRDRAAVRVPPADPGLARLGRAVRDGPGLRAGRRHPAGAERHAARSSAWSASNRPSRRSPRRGWMRCGPSRSR